MIDLDSYLQALLEMCKAAFADRLLYVGLQGSYMRGEAKESSDIDVMLLLDRLSVNDMDVYREILCRVGQSEKACGFLCGAEEMKRWNPLEICHLKHTTKDLYGSLSMFLPDATRDDEINYAKLSLGNLYHELCHRYIHATREENVLCFRATCKGLFFLIQNLHYLESGTFAVTKKELRELVSKDDRAVLALSELPDGYNFDRAFSCVFTWCRNAFLRIDRLKSENAPATER